MQEQYDNAEKAAKFSQYRNEKRHHTHVTVPSVRKLLGNDLTGKRCLDLACGSGQSTRILADMKPLELFGVDISQHMIDIAKQESSNDPNYSRIKYFVGDCSQPLELKESPFDLVFSMHFLQYSESREHLAAIVRTMFGVTRPGGTCAGLTISPFVKKEQLPKLFKYGTELSIDGFDLTTRLFDGDARDGRLLIELKTHLWEPQTYEKCFLDAGFINFEWVDLGIGDEFQDLDGFLSDFIHVASSILFKAHRPIS